MEQRVAPLLKRVHPRTFRSEIKLHTEAKCYQLLIQGSFGVKRFMKYIQ